MKNLKTKKFWAFGAALIALAPLASCSNEEAVTAPEPYVDPAPEGYQTIQIEIPGYAEQIGSRAQMDVNGTEGNISELWLIAFPVENESGQSTGQFFIQDLQQSGTLEGNSTQWKQPGTATVQLKLGTYNIYVLANINDYISVSTNKISGTNITSSTRSKVENLTLNFSDFSGNQIIPKDKLPMVCNYTDIQRATGSSTTPQAITSGKFVVDGTTGTKLYAPMSLLCAKVRYTVLFELAQSSFFSASGVDFTGAKIYNVATKETWPTASTLTVDDYNTEATAINLGRYTWDSSTDDLVKSYKDISDVSANNGAPANLTVTSTDWNSDADTQRVWQGIVYVLENKSGSSKTTAIQMQAASGSNIKIDDITAANPKGVFTFSDIACGNFYDVVAELKTPETLNFDVNVYVQVNPWTYVPSPVLPW